ncbi:Transmembrane protein [Trema orientale]|uniref:Transmembrane protein n=1 Tax=Trema orientale TaxID=63057 RepID=A0A2P5CWD5_TREOI|nr:Transmembrane protein [Trema orientale]
MAASASAILHGLYLITPYHSKCSKTLSRSAFLSSGSFLCLKKQTFLPELRIKKKKKQLRTQNSPSLPPLVFAAQTNFLKVIQTAWKVARDGVEAGTNLVPDSVPRPIARISVTVVALTVALFVLKSFLSTAFFVLATMGLVYFTFIAFYKDEGPRGGEDTTSTKDTPTSSEDALEEARRIMEKYK